MMTTKTAARKKTITKGIKIMSMTTEQELINRKKYLDQIGSRKDFRKTMSSTKKMMDSIMESIEDMYDASEKESSNAQTKFS